MPTAKKLLFAPFFLGFFYLSVYFFESFRGKTDILVAFNLSLLKSYSFLTLTIFLSILFFGIFVSLAVRWFYILPVTLTAGLIPILFFNPALLPFIIGSFLSLLIGFLLISNKLKTYLTFKPGEVLGPGIKAAGKLLVLSLAITYFFSVKTSIDKNGFQVPDSIINTALKFSPVQDQQLPVSIPNLQLPSSSSNPAKLPTNSLQKPTATSSPSTPLALPSLTPEQLDLLKQNPELLQQYGIDPQVLNQLENSQVKGISTTNDPIQLTIKSLVKDQLDSLIKPYLPFIPYVLALTFLVALYTFLEVIFIILPSLLWLIFEILEEIGFIHFEKEMREVKKMVV